MKNLHPTQLSRNYTEMKALVLEEMNSANEVSTPKSKTGAFCDLATNKYQNDTNPTSAIGGNPVCKRALENPSTANKHLNPSMEECSLKMVQRIKDKKIIENNN